MNLENVRNIPDAFIKKCKIAQSNPKIAFRYKKQGKWVDVFHSELFEKVSNLAISLLELGFTKGDRISIISENRIEWIISSFAISMIGAVDVPLFPILTNKQIEYIFNDAQVKGIVVSNDFQLNKILDILNPNQLVFIMNDEHQKVNFNIHSLSNLIESASKKYELQRRNEILNNCINNIDKHDLLTIIYTSGTTGVPKGVMLSHNNLISNILGSNVAIGDLSNHKTLSYLPFCHSYERCAGFYIVFFAGAEVAIAESIESVPLNITEIKPTLMTTVPKLLETIKKKILINVENESIIKKNIFNWAYRIGIKKIYNQNNFRINLLYKLATFIVFDKILQKMGGNLKIFISGGAPLPIEVGEFFSILGINILQGYGLTEVSPVVSTNTLSNNELGTVGQVLYNLKVKLAEDGEILIKGPSVTRGYWNDLDSVDTLIDSEGWLYSGDIGEFSEKGNLKITGRKKEILVSSGGKNIAPQAVESVICQSKYIDNCALIGDNREYITALISPNLEQLKQLANYLGIEFVSNYLLVKNEQINKHIDKEISSLQKDFSKFERIRRFTILETPFSVDGGELSPKMSLKRHIINKKYADIIEEMYS